MVYPEDKANELEAKLIAAYGEGTKVPILKLRENEDSDIRHIAEFVYENIFVKYTMKQWGKKPEEIDPAVTGRVPVLISHDNRYFTDTYQGMPKDGYTGLIEKMLSHPNIEVRTGVDAISVLRFEDHQIYFENQIFEGPVIYTGAIDTLFGCRYGRLPYRGLEFKFEYYEQDEYQPKAVVNYTVSEDYTRITEFKKLTGQKAKGTTIVKEYPYSYTGEKGQVPYYAMNDPKSQALYDEYKKLACNYENLWLLGRLAEYKYYNIDAIVKHALEMVRTMK